MKAKEILSAITDEDVRVRFIDDDDTETDFWLSDWRDGHNRGIDDIDVVIEVNVIQGVDIVLIKD